MLLVQAHAGHTIPNLEIGNLPHSEITAHSSEGSLSGIYKGSDTRVDTPPQGMRDGGVTTQVRRRAKADIIRVKSGSAFVPIYVSDSMGATRYTVAFYRDGRRIRRTFGDLEKARREAKLAADNIQRGMAVTLDLRPSDREAYHSALNLLKELQVPLVAAVEEYVKCRGLLGGKPLLATVDDYVRRNHGVRTGATVPDVAKEFLAAKEKDGLSPRYMQQLKTDVGRFAAAYPLPILHVKSNHIAEWVSGLYGSPRSRNTIHTSICTFFSWAKSRAYLPKNEITEAEAVSKMKVGDTVTEIFTPDQMAKILAIAPAEVVPFVVIGAFAGLRNAEIQRLDWSAIDLDRKIIQVRADQAKTASRRIVPISDNLKEWLAPHVTTGRIVKTTWIDRLVTPLAKSQGFKWPRNVLRHSFISYRIAVVKSAEQVALEAGNSPTIIFKHYRELATEEEATAWFNIRPQGTGKSA